MRRTGLAREAAEARLAAQLPLEEKRRLATFVIDNSGEREGTRQQVLLLHARLESSLHFLWARLAAGVLLASLSGLGYLLLRRLLS